LAALTDATIELIIAGMSSGDVERLKARMQERLPVDADGRITYAACANAVKGRRPS
jgi:hypothetical protein